MQPDWQGGSKVFRVPFVMVLLVASLLATPAGANETEDAEPEAPLDTLYFLPATSDREGNFTTYPPTGTEPVLAGPDETPLSRFFWHWKTVHAPHNWTLAPDDEILATVYLEGLDRVVPTPDLRTPPDKVGMIRVQVEILVGTRGSGGSLEGPADPVYANATGTVWLDPLEQQAATGPVMVEVPVVARDRFHGDEAFEMGVRVVVSGTTPADQRPNLALGSTSTPTHVRIPSFPVSAFREWEDAERESQECLRRILVGESCAERPTPDAEPPEVVTKESPAFSPLVLLAICLVMLSSRGARRTGRQAYRPPSLCRGRVPSR